MILIPEIPYEVENVARAIRSRVKKGKHFSIVVVAEGAMSRTDALRVGKLVRRKEEARSRVEKNEASERLRTFHESHVNHTIELTRQLEKLVRQESRLTILGHLQRGGTPSALDRVFATSLGTRCVDTLRKEQYGVMLALQGTEIRPIALEQVAGKKKLVPRNHPLVQSARLVGTQFGD